MNTTLSEMPFRAAVVKVLEGHGVIDPTEILERFGAYIDGAEWYGMEPIRCANNIMKRWQR